MTGRPWYKRYPVNFIHGTMGLSLEEKGAYSIILDLIYDRGGPIVDDARYIAGVCNCSLRKWSSIRLSLIQAGKIALVDGKITNARAEKEIEFALNSAKERAESGAKGGRKATENRSDANENNGLSEAELEHTRAVLELEARNKNIEDPAPPAGGSPPKGEKRGTRVDGFVPDLDAAADLGLGADRARLQADKFIDFWRGKPGASGLKRDWPATWRNWVRSEIERNGQTNFANGGRSHVQSHGRRETQGDGIVAGVRETLAKRNVYLAAQQGEQDRQGDGDQLAPRGGTIELRAERRDGSDFRRAAGDGHGRH